jgi:hypothetical protein
VESVEYLKMALRDALYYIVPAAPPPAEGPNLLPLMGVGKSAVVPLGLLKLLFDFRDKNRWFLGGWCWKGPGGGIIIGDKDDKRF